jgi:dTDP-4-dehydrorhamnose 3,5-epimerase-like enzyme
MLNPFTGVENMDKVYREKLPERKDIDGAKRWSEEKGEFVQISYREDIGHLAFFELKKGYVRGNHYHEKKEEVFYIISGKVRALFVDIDSSEKEEQILTKGDKIKVSTRVGHVFHGMEDTLVVEYSPQYYDKEDSVRMDLED